MSISSQLCKCGCGQFTQIATRTKTSRGHVKGEPLPRLRGHHGTAPASERFWAKVQKSDECWLWTGKKHAEGYGMFRNDRRSDVLAHRYSYELHVGPIPEGLHIDHLCRVRNCVNPSHLEPVTPGENVRRGMAPAIVAWRTNTCHKGHVDQYVTYPNGARRCHPCLREWREARKAAVA